jgi:hypothetical protein
LGQLAELRADLADGLVLAGQTATEVTLHGVEALADGRLDGIEAVVDLGVHGVQPLVEPAVERADLRLKGVLRFAQQLLSALDRACHGSDLLFDPHGLGIWCGALPQCTGESPARYADSADKRSDENDDKSFHAQAPFG